MPTASGHDVVPLESEEVERQERDFKGYLNQGMVRLNPGRWLFLSPFLKLADKLYNFKVKPNDVFILTWPKCGTTWAQEIVWTMRNNPNLDNPLGKDSVNARVPFLEFDSLMQSEELKPSPNHPVMLDFQKKCPGKDPADGIFVQMCEVMPDPRTIKSHLPLSLLPPDLTKVAKAVYVARNPKDVVISFHHHSRLFKNHSYVGSFADFVQYFVDDDLVYGPYWRHLKEAWQRREDPNVHFIFYEDLKSDNMTELKKLNDFLGTKLSQEQLENISRHTSFSKMKERDGLIPTDSDSGSDFFHQEVIDKDGGFFRKGNVGDWKGKYTPELEAKIDDWIKKHLHDLGINFKYSI